MIVKWRDEYTKKYVISVHLYENSTLNVN